MSSTPPPRKSPTGYPLLLLFVIVALAGVLSGMNSLLFRALQGELSGGEGVGTKTLLVTAVGGVAAGSLLGAIIGLVQARRVGQGLLGGLVGAVLGVIVAPLLLVPAEHAIAMTMMFLLGTGLMFAASAVHLVRRKD